MAKKVVIQKGGKLVTLTAAQQKSGDAGAIPWTRGPDTIGRKIVRNLVG